MAAPVSPVAVAASDTSPPLLAAPRLYTAPRGPPSSLSSFPFSLSLLRRRVLVSVHPWEKRQWQYIARCLWWPWRVSQPPGPAGAVDDLCMMSVVAAQAAGLAPAAVVAVPYGLCGGGGGGARKRKDVVGQEEDGRGGGCDGDGDDAVPRHGLFLLETVEEEEDDDERSFIGTVSDSDSDDDDQGEEAESKETPPSPCRRRKNGGALTCLDALDDALPIKRGLSNFFSGKSRSFANLQDVTSGGAASACARDVLAKPENPFNKRRRILRCTSIRRVSSTSLTALPPFWPPQRPPLSRCTHDVDAGATAAGNGTDSG